jgi:hypothetical protein
MSPNKLLKVVAFMQGRNKRMLKRVLKAMPKKLNYLKPKNEYRYGVKILTGRPTRANKNYPNMSNNGSRGSNGSMNNDNFFGKKNVHFRRGGLNNARNMVIHKKKKPKVSRFNVGNNFEVMKPANKGGRYHPKNNSPTSSERKRMKPKVANVFVNFLAHTKNVRTGVHNRVPTRPRQVPGTKARSSNARLNSAALASRNKYKKAVSPKMSPSQRASLANKLLLKEIFGSNSPQRRRVMFNSSPKSAPPSPKKRRNKYSTAFSRKLASMARRAKSRKGFRAVNALVSTRPTNFLRSGSNRSGSMSGSMSGSSRSGSNSKK